MLYKFTFRCIFMLSALVLFFRTCSNTPMVRYLLIDLDNTLYPASSGLEKEISRLMSLFVAQYLRISVEDAQYLRRTNAIPYGTTLQWLRTEFGFHDLDGYFDAVHPKNVEDFIKPDPQIAKTLDSIDLPKAILTNSPREHTDRVLAHLGVADRFSRIFDIRYNRFQGKPYRDTYKAVLQALGQKISDVLFIDDMPRYLQPFQDLGGHCLLVDEENRHDGINFEKIRRITELKDYLKTHHDC